MKKIYLIIIIFVLVTLNLFPIKPLKVLILPFGNKSYGDDINDRSTLILDTIKTDIIDLPSRIKVDEFKNEILEKLRSSEDEKLLEASYSLALLDDYYELNLDISSENADKLREVLKSVEYKKFLPLSLKDISVNDDKISDYTEIHTEALLRGIDLIISGHYIELNGRVRIVFKVIDVKTERVKIVFEKTGKSGYEIFDVILAATKEVIEKMHLEISSVDYMMNPVLKEKQSRIIGGDEKERFLFFSFGISYSGMGFANTETNDLIGLDITTSSNCYENSVNPSFKFEVYSNYKNNYYGFGMQFVIPFIYFVPNMMMYSEIFLGYRLGFRKVHFFAWSLGLMYNGFQKYSDAGERVIEVFYLGIGFDFTYRYMPKKYPFFVEVGTTFVPPFLPKEEQNTDDSGGGPDPWNISTGIVSSQNFISPVIFHGSAGYFINKNFGIYFRNSLYFMYISYEKYKDINNNLTIFFDFGEDLAIAYNIEFGVVFRGVFK